MLELSDTTFRDICVFSPDIVAVLGLDGVVRYINPAVQDVLGCSPQDRVCRSATETIHPDDRDTHERTLRQIIATGTPARVRLRLLHAAGHWVPLESHMGRLTDTTGQPVGVVIIARNAADRVRAEEALEEARQAAERANRAKDEFLSRMSHELRTPLNAILGFAQLIEMDPLPKEHREGVEHIIRASRHLLELINEVLDISRIESGRLALSPEPINLAEVLEEATDLVSVLAKKASVSIHPLAPQWRSSRVLADRQRLKQVFLNLLTNAVKFNHKGGSVTLGCEARGGQVLRLSVSDTGIGIAPEDHGRLFAPFARLQGVGGKVEGTGLGLALCKRLVEAMGGEIGVESTPGQGSTFWVELPAAGADSHPDALVSTDRGAEVGDAHAAGPRHAVLCIDDNPANHAVIVAVLAQSPGVRVLEAMQGRLGLLLAREHRPDLILLDLHLPDLPGDEILRRLRTDPLTCRIPVVVISADASIGQRNRLMALGAHEFLSKPIDVRKLQAILAETLVGHVG